MKEQTYRVNILNNEYWVTVYIGKDVKKLKKILVKHFEDDYIEMNQARGRCFTRYGYLPYIWVNTKECKTNKLFFSTLAHEAVHAVDEIFALHSHVN